MGNPDVTITPQEVTKSEALDRNLQYLVVDTQGGFLGKETAELMDQMGYKNVRVVTLDSIGANQDQIIDTITNCDYVVCTDLETESRIGALIPMDAAKPVLPLGLTRLDRHEVTPLDHGGSGRTDVSRFLNVLEERLVSVGFDYPDSAK